MASSPRDRVQTASRIVALVFVILWLLSTRLQSTVPFWLPFIVLLAMEAEFVVRGVRERRAETPAPPASRRLPGADDADLGWVESVDEEGEPILVPAPRGHAGGSAAPPSSCSSSVSSCSRSPTASTARPGGPAVGRVDRDHAQMRFTTEASRIAGRAVRVYCDDTYAFTGVGSDAAGVAFIPRALAYLEPTVCRSLYRIAFEDKLGPRDEAAFAITVLAHEATHLRGIRDEAETECYALQEGVGLGRRLGLDAATARGLMEAQRTRDLSDASIARLDYRLPAECRNGGSLDLRPNDPSLPVAAPPAASEPRGSRG